MHRRALRGAFIGFGNVAAKAHLPVWQFRDDVTIVAAADTAPARRAAFLAARPNARWYGTADALLAAETLDFVDICTPPGSHARLIDQVLNAGLHVLCEKPLVTRAADALAVAAAAARAGRIVHTVHNWLEAPICLRISALIAEGAIGAVRSVRWRTLRTQPAAAVEARGENWRVAPVVAGGGVLFDHGWHALYCIMRWAGGAPRGVAASLETRSLHGSPVEDTATLTLDFAAGAGQVHVTWTANERSNQIDVEGERGRIYAIGDRVVLTGPLGERQWSCPPPLSEGSHHPDWFAGVSEGFCTAVSEGTRGNINEAVLCARLIDLARQSSAAGGVRIPLEA